MGQKFILYVATFCPIRTRLTVDLGQRWQLHLTLSKPLYRGHGNGGVLATLTGSAYIVWYVHNPSCSSPAASRVRIRRS